MVYKVQRFDSSEWWTFQTTEDFITAVWLRDNSFDPAVMTRIKAD
jgi:hypothetical protein